MIRFATNWPQAALLILATGTSSSFAADMPRHRSYDTTWAAAPAAVAPPQDAASDPYAGLGLFQRLSLWLGGAGQTSRPPQILAYAAPAAMPAEAPAIEIVDYSGPLPPGTIVINMDKKQIFRILHGGRAELHNNRTDLVNFFVNPI